MYHMGKMHHMKITPLWCWVGVTGGVSVFGCCQVSLAVVSDFLVLHRYSDSQHGSSWSGLEHMKGGLIRDFCG